MAGAAAAAVACSHAPPTVYPVVDRDLYLCAEATTAQLGFVARRDTGTTATRLTVTTQPDQRSGQYDGLAIQVLGDTSRIHRWIEVEPFSGVLNRGGTRNCSWPARAPGRRRRRWSSAATRARAGCAA